MYMYIYIYIYRQVGIEESFEHVVVMVEDFSSLMIQEKKIVRAHTYKYMYIYIYIDISIYLYIDICIDM